MGTSLRRVPRLFLATLCAAGAGFAGTANAWQCENFGPMSTGFRTSQSFFYDQVWSEVGHTTNGFVFAWSEGQDILMRRYDAGLNPIAGDTLVNATLNLGQQDEPAVCGGTTGNFLIAWSERNGYDGDQMGIFGRVYNASGNPLANEFQINQIWQASQWRPLIAPTPSGGFAVAWSGDWDGNAYYRLFSSTGAPLTNDILVNQYTNDAQVDTALALGSGGNAFVVFVDFSSHAGFSGTDVYGRIFNAAGSPLTNEFLLPSTWNYGDQRTPRVATDGQGHFDVVWTSELVDGAGYAIVARRFDAAGNGLGPEFQVNTTTVSDQIEPRIAMQSDGDFLISWEDYSTGVPRILCRRFNADGTPKGGEVQVSDAGVEATLPEMWMSTTSGEVVCAYEAWNGVDSDVYARRFLESTTPQIFCTAKMNSAGCTPQIGFSGAPSATSLSAFDITATNVLNQSSGLLFYGFNSTFTPFQGATLCTSSPRRTQIQFSGGATSGHNCTGVFTYDFNARVQSGVDATLTAGKTVSVQYYYRDVQDPTGYGSGLTNALRFTICP